MLTQFHDLDHPDGPASVVWRNESPGSNVLKLFCVAIDAVEKARVFVPGKIIIYE